MVLKRKWMVLIAGAVPLLSGVPASAQQTTVAPEADYNWRLEALDGTRRSLADSRGRVVFINLWATWCSPCIAELASIQRLHDSLGGTPIDFLIVSPEQRGTVRSFIRRRKHTFPVFLESEPIPESFGLRALPTTYVIDRDGRVVLSHRGAVDWDHHSIREFLRGLAGAATAVGTGEQETRRPPASPTRR